MDRLLQIPGETDEALRWIAASGLLCSSAPEFLLRAAAEIGKDEDWFACEAESGAPFYDALFPNPGLLADVVRQTRIFDKVGQLGLFWLPLILVADDDPCAELARAWAEKRAALTEVNRAEQGKTT